MWTPCAAAPAALARFGHTSTAVQQRSAAGAGEALVVYGGVTAQRSPDGNAAPAQKALGDVVVLPAGSDEWVSPAVSAPEGSPGPRAFHCAASGAAGQLVVFGGHILTLDSAGRKRRVFYNDCWGLDTVCARGDLLLAFCQIDVHAWVSRDVSLLLTELWALVGPLPAFSGDRPTPLPAPPLHPWPARLGVAAP